MATVVLHAAVLDGRIAHVTDGELRSYRDLVNDLLPRDAPQDVLRECFAAMTSLPCDSCLAGD